MSYYPRALILSTLLLIASRDAALALETQEVPLGIWKAKRWIFTEKGSSEPRQQKDDDGLKGSILLNRCGNVNRTWKSQLQLTRISSWSVPSSSEHSTHLGPVWEWICLLRCISRSGTSELHRIIALPILGGRCKRKDLNFKGLSTRCYNYFALRKDQFLVQLVLKQKVLLPGPACIWPGGRGTSKSMQVRQWI